MLADGFHRSGLAGTGFLIAPDGLAATAAHVLFDVAPEFDVKVALPTAGPMKAHSVVWKVRLPRSDIAICKIDVESSACFAVRLQPLLMAQDVETCAIPASMLQTDNVGRTQVLLRAAKGYVSYGTDSLCCSKFLFA